jgi:hypothetical protein
MISRTVFLIVCSFLLLAGNHVLAHHAYSTDFDPDKYGTVAGEVVEVFYANPHAQYIMRVKNADGVNVNWAIVTMNLGAMANIGWTKDTLQVGDKVEVYGRLGRDDRPLIWPQTVTKSDGTVLDLGSAGPLK